MNPQFRSAFFDAVVLATLAGVVLSSLVGCASTTAAHVANAIDAGRSPSGGFLPESCHNQGTKCADEVQR